jgi:hypothetical protein
MVCLLEPLSGVCAANLLERDLPAGTGDEQQCIPHHNFKRQARLLGNTTSSRRCRPRAAANNQIAVELAEAYLFMPADVDRDGLFAREPAKGRLGVPPADARVGFLLQALT